MLLALFKSLSLLVWISLALLPASEGSTLMLPWDSRHSQFLGLLNNQPCMLYNDSIFTLANQSSWAAIMTLSNTTNHADLLLASDCFFHLQPSRQRLSLHWHNRAKPDTRFRQCANPC